MARELKVLSILCVSNVKQPRWTRSLTFYQGSIKIDVKYPVSD